MLPWPWRSPETQVPHLTVSDARSADADAVVAFCREAPVDAALLGEHVEAMARMPFYRDQLLCVTDTDELSGLCWVGGNMVPFRIPDAAFGRVAGEIRRRGRRYSSVVGSADQVLGLWAHLERHLPAPRDVRENQPSMLIDHAPLVASDPDVSVTAPEDLDVLVPACVEMFTEEVGYSPLTVGGGYQRRIRDLVGTGRSLSRIEDTPRGRSVVFKAELGTVALGVTQVQGVWVRPDLRGRGIAEAGMAAVVRHALAHVAPNVSLYVNAYNLPALAVYRRVGFRQVGTFATILF